MFNQRLQDFTNSLHHLKVDPCLNPVLPIGWNPMTLKLALHIKKEASKAAGQKFNCYVLPFIPAPEKFYEKFIESIINYANIVVPPGKTERIQIILGQGIPKVSRDTKHWVVMDLALSAKNIEIFYIDPASFYDPKHLYDYQQHFLQELWLGLLRSGKQSTLYYLNCRKAKIQAAKHNCAVFALDIASVLATLDVTQCLASYSKNTWHEFLPDTLPTGLVKILRSLQPTNSFSDKYYGCFKDVLVSKKNSSDTIKLYDYVLQRDQKYKKPQIDKHYQGILYLKEKYQEKIKNYLDEVLKDTKKLNDLSMYLDNLDWSKLAIYGLEPDIVAQLSKVKL